MEILLPSTGSRAIAGANGREARSASSWGLGGGGASAESRLPFGFGAGPSSVSTGGGSITAGRGSTESTVWMSAGGRALGARGEGRAQAASKSPIARITACLIPTTISADGVPLLTTRREDARGTGERVARRSLHWRRGRSPGQDSSLL